MKFNLYTVYDSKSGIYSPPFCFINHPVAVRSFTESVKNVDSQIAKTPDDFSLLLLGTYDDVTAVADMLIAPETIITGRAVVHSLSEVHHEEV